MGRPTISRKLMEWRSKMPDIDNRARYAPSNINPQQQITSFDIVRPFLDVAPVNLLAMADALGITVDMTASLGPNSGRITQNSPGHYLVEVNREHSFVRQRFTLAHEIGHYLLHRNQIGNGITDDGLYRSNLSSYVETEANRMAAELLMPANLIRVLWRSGVRSIAQLCDNFQVSEAALRIRLKQLRLAP